MFRELTYSKITKLLAEISSTCKNDVTNPTHARERKKKMANLHRRLLEDLKVFTELNSKTFRGFKSVYGAQLEDF